ncbi:MAG TPA: hypothetical protein VF656_20635 [Pyrinomonadaceae bacterium]|jgi:hypothetical protein
MSKLPSSYIVEAFLDNNRNRIWRIEWFGEVDLNPQVPSEQTIEVVLVPLKEAEIDPQTINKKSSYEYRERCVVRVGVGLLPCLHIGTLWRNGHQLQTPSYTDLSFNNLLITPETSRITDAHRNPDLIITKYHPTVSNCVKAKYLIIDLDKDQHSVNQQSKLIIPCVEIARFYYTNSTQLTKAIIGGGLDTHANDVYDPRKTRLPGDDGIGFVQLRQNIKDADKEVVARFAFDPIANRNARNINASIIRNAFNEGCAVLEARPPFERTSDLKVQGKWIRSADEIWHFLVYQIVSCTAPFPFEQLDWARDNDGTSVGERDLSLPVAYPGRIKKPVRPPERKEGDQEITNVEEPSLDYAVTDIELDSDRFPDLRDKKAGKKFRNTENQTRADIFRPSGPEDINKFSTGDGGHEGKKIAPFSVTQHEQEQSQDNDKEGRRTRLPAGLDNFKDILHELEKLGDVTTALVLLDSESDDADIKSCTYFPVLHGRRTLKWSYIDFDEQHRRQAMIAHCRYNNAHFYIMDIEVKEDDDSDRYSMLLLNDTRLIEVGAGRLRAVLHFAAQKKGRWIHDWELKNLAKERFKHDLDAPAKHARRFFKHMQFVAAGVAQVALEVPPTVDESRMPSEEETAQYTIDQKKIVGG